MSFPVKVRQNYLQVKSICILSTKLINIPQHLELEARIRKLQCANYGQFSFL